MAESELPLGFRVIPGFPEYTIGRHGDVRNIQTNRRIKISKGSNGGSGYVSIRKDGKSYQRLVHDLLVLAWSDS